jgi:hypothetical protein
MEEWMERAIRAQRSSGMVQLVCCGVLSLMTTVFPGALTVDALTEVPILPDAEPVQAHETAFVGDDWSATIYSYVFDEDSLTPSGLVLEPGELLFVYLIQVDEGSASSVTLTLVTNPCEALINAVGYISDVEPVGLDASMREAPFIYGYSSPSASTVWNFTGDPQNPQSTLDPGEWSMLFHVAEADEWSMVNAGVSVGGPPLLGEVLGVVLLPCLADVNGDGLIDLDDIAEVLAHWGEIGGPADIDGEPGVGTGDLLLVLNYFGDDIDD